MTGAGGESSRTDAGDGRTRDTSGSVGVSLRHRAGPALRPIGPGPVGRWSRRAAPRRAGLIRQSPYDRLLLAGWYGVAVLLVLTRFWTYRSGLL
ncbi:hypothetical protein DKG34_36620 [Streptomyces sp. NWU49]|nr:hypothetical protein DKG34_36620 [Streptomyces sp. NWU49]